LGLRPSRAIHSCRHCDWWMIKLRLPNMRPHLRTEPQSEASSIRHKQAERAAEQSKTENDNFTAPLC
jgi:hypothetical protein